ncbi:hypothetical protein PCE1_002330 [Barthelona sp. PCE]
MFSSNKGILEGNSIDHEGVIDFEGHEGVIDQQLWIFDWQSKRSRGLDIPASSTAICQVDDVIYCFGGRRSDTNDVREQLSNEFYTVDLGTMEVSRVECDQTLVPEPRAGHTLSYDEIHNRLVLFGGQTSADTETRSIIYFYELDNNKWVIPEISGVMPRGRHGHATVIIDKKFYLVGGFSSGNYLNDLYIMDLNELCWQRIDSTVAFPPRYGHTLNYYELENSIYLFGGYKYALSKEYYGDLWKFDLDRMEWTCVDKGACQGRDSHCAFIVKDPDHGSRLVILFGREEHGCCDEIDMYDFSNGTWSHRSLNDSTFSPSSRFSVSACALKKTSSSSSFLFIGGANTSNDRFNDIWVLTVQSMVQGSSSQAHLNTFLPSQENDFNPPLADAHIQVGHREWGIHSCIVGVRCRDLILDSEALQSASDKVGYLILYYIYCDSLPNGEVTPAEIAETAYFAKSLQLSHLELICLTRFGEILSPKTVLDACRIISQYGTKLSSFLKEAIAYILTNESSIDDTTFSNMLALECGLDVYKAGRNPGHTQSFVSVDPEANTTWNRALSMLSSYIDGSTTRSIVDSSLLPDFVLRLGDNSHSVQVHRIILAVSCERFAKLFENNPSISDMVFPAIVPLHLQPDIIDKFARFLYLFMLPTLDLRAAYVLFCLCVYLGFDNSTLIENCVQILKQPVADNDIFDVLQSCRDVIESDEMKKMGMNDFHIEIFKGVENRAMDAYWVADESIKTSPALHKLRHDVLIDLLKKPTVDGI